MPNHGNKGHVPKVTLFHHWMSELCAAPELHTIFLTCLDFKTVKCPLQRINIYSLDLCVYISVVLVLYLWSCPNWQWDVPRSNLGAWLMQYFFRNKLTPMQSSRCQRRFPNHPHVMLSAWQTTKTYKQIMQTDLTDSRYHIQWTHMQSVQSTPWLQINCVCTSQRMISSFQS